MVNKGGDGVVNDGVGLSQAALGRALGLAPPTITKLKSQGMPVTSVAEAQAWREQRQNIAARKPLPTAAQAVLIHQDEPLANSSVANIDESRARLMEADAELAEIKLAEARADVVRASVIRTVLANALSATRETLLQIPARLAPVLAPESDAAHIERALGAEITAALEHLSTQVLNIAKPTELPTP